MDYSVTDNAGRRVAVKAHNWLFAIASGLRALEVDAAALTSLNCSYEPDGSILVQAPGNRSWWVKSLGAQLPFSAATPFEAAPVPSKTPPPPTVSKAPPPAASKTPPPPAAAPPPPRSKPAPASRSVPPRAPATPTPTSHRAPPTATETPQPLHVRSAPQARELQFEEDAMNTVRNAPPATPPQPPRKARPERAITVVVSKRSTLLEDNDQLFADEAARIDEEETVIDLAVPAPAFRMPSSSLIPEEQESLAERLFEASMDFMGAEPAEACQIALDLVNEFVPCEASSIAVGTLNDRELTFVAATGPVADQIVSRTLPFGKGLVGMCFDMRTNINVANIKDSKHHFAGFDDETGYESIGALCVPILDESGLVHGVIQLLNPTKRPFYNDDEEAVENIARALASALAFS